MRHPDYDDFGWNRVHCDVCGERGVNSKALRAWFGDPFVHRDAFICRDNLKYMTKEERLESYYPKPKDNLAGFQAVGAA